MEATLKELAKLEKLVSNSSSSKGKTPSIEDSLDALLRTLHDTRDRIQSGDANLDTYTTLQQKVDASKKDVDDRQKEVYNSLARFGKTLDKVAVQCHSSQRSAVSNARRASEVPSAAAVVSTDVLIA